MRWRTHVGGIMLGLLGKWHGPVKGWAPHPGYVNNAGKYWSLLSSGPAP